ncbi:hypothetical protein [Hydrogenothermus marinus]|uniref:Uncharacterized protein n=1 Tax=Hydrogenothermus marinus TaxID=133270 RepID=A0A3M0BSA7_9AQUI|nr:hypothetical protein [Hydrogenothermus marinus]RMB00062.1 hypothetical protein CLV39_0056 [Hydrogenothermus marinus]
MKIIIRIPDEIVYKIGKRAIKEKIEKTLNFLELEELMKEISEDIRKVYTEEEYWKEVEKIRQEAWQEYKKGLDLE